MSQPALPLEHVTALNCPRCGQRMVQRTNRDTDEPFLGCSAWPDCAHSQDLPADMELGRQGADRLPGF